MPPLRSQTVLPDGLELVTTQFGTLRLTLTGTGNSRTVTVTRDGVQVAQAVVTNVTAQKLEDWLNAWLAGNLRVVFADGTTPPALNAVVHVFGLAPLSLTILSTDFDVPVPPNWWQA